MDTALSVANLVLTSVNVVATVTLASYMLQTKRTVDDKIQETETKLERAARQMKNVLNEL